MPVRIRKIKTSPFDFHLTHADKEKLLESVFRINAYMTNQPNLDEILSKILRWSGRYYWLLTALSSVFLMRQKRYLITKVVKNYSPEEADRAFAVTLIRTVTTVWRQSCNPDNTWRLRMLPTIQNYRDRPHVDKNLLRGSISVLPWRQAMRSLAPLLPGAVRKRNSSPNRLVFSNLCQSDQHYDS